MPQSSIIGGATTSAMVGIPESYSEQMHVLALREASLLALLAPDMGENEPVRNWTHYYNDLVFRPSVTTLNGAINNVTTTVVLAEAIYRSGEIICIDKETILLGATANGLTFTNCSRGVNSGGTGAAHADGAMVVGLGKPYVQNAAADTAGQIWEPNVLTNYVECFADFMVIPDAVKNLDQYFRPGVSRFEYERDQLMARLLHQLENSLIWGTAQAPSGSTTAGKMGGFYDRVAASYSSSLGGAAIDEDNMRAAIRNAGNFGGGPRFIVAANLFSCDVFDKWKLPHIESQQGAEGEGVYGVNVTQLRMSGCQLDIVRYPKARSNLLIIDPKFVKLRALQDSGWKLQQEARDGLREKWDLSGYFTCEIGCAQAHYIFTGVKES